METFSQISPNQEFFSSIPSWLIQKIRKILQAVSEETALPTNQQNNQPIITNNIDFIGPGWRQSKNQ